MSERLVPPMPPLLPEETIQPGGNASNFVGNSCEQLVKFYLMKQGINFAEPAVDDGIDLWVEKEKGSRQIERVQIKKVSYHSRLEPIACGSKPIPECTEEELTRRDKFYYWFQSTRSKVERGPEDIDVFYHVYVTKYRNVIWKTDSSLIKLNDRGKFPPKAECNLLSEGINFKPLGSKGRSQLDWRDTIVYTYYDPILFREFPDFFLREKATLEPFLAERP